MVKRHIISDFHITSMLNTEYQEECILRCFQRITNGLKANLEAYKADPLFISTASIFLGKNLEVVAPNLSLYLDMAIGHLEKCLRPEDVFKIQLGNRMFEVPRKESYSKSEVSISHWYPLINVAILLRSERHLTYLQEMGIVKMNPTEHSYWYHVGLFMEVLFEGNPEKIEEVVSMVEYEVGKDIARFAETADNGDAFMSDSEEILLCYWLPNVWLYQSVFKGDARRFNAVLEAYLLRKKAFIIKHGNNDDNWTWVDYNALGCCAYAHDRGIEITVESEYIPAWLYKGEWEI